VALDTTRPFRLCQRRDHSNGIWLCQIHGKLVDSDEVHFTVTMLREWKTQAEQSSFRAILSGQGAPPNSALPLSVVDQLIERIRAAAVADLAGFRRGPGWQSHPIALSLRLTSGVTERQFNAKTIGAAVSAFNELVIVAPPGTSFSTESSTATSGPRLEAAGVCACLSDPAGE